MDLDKPEVFGKRGHLWKARQLFQSAGLDMGFDVYLDPWPPRSTVAFSRYDWR
jgi:hypothetical protein